MDSVMSAEELAGFAVCASEAAALVNDKVGLGLSDLVEVFTTAPILVSTAAALLRAFTRGLKIDL